MGVPGRLLNPVVAAILTGIVALLPPHAGAQTEALDELFAQLQSAPGDRWQPIERQIWREWAKSGSPAMDLLLRRGQEAMEAGKLDEAIEHFTALTDHAPDFAEGWNARATAFFRDDRYGQALADIRQVLALNPRHFGALSGLGRILEELGEEEAALRAYRVAHDLHPHQPGIRAGIERLERRVSGHDL